METPSILATEDKELLRLFTKKENGVISLLQDIRFYLKKLDDHYGTTGFMVCGPSVPPVDVLGI